MNTHDDSIMIWVSPEGDDKGAGTYESPYKSIGRALQRARPGNHVVLRQGSYPGNLTVQVSGTMRAPIQIVAEEGAQVDVPESSWFFYDVSDLIVSGIEFRRFANVAVSVVGRCERNCFRGLVFAGGETTDTSRCTMYFGGSGSRHNVVEECRFEATSPSDSREGSIGILVAEGDDEEGARANTKHIFRRNTFRNYRCAIMLGSRDVPGKHYGHIVEENRIEGGDGDGIGIRCGDTIVRRNHLRGCSGDGIAVLTGRDSTIVDNRIEDCGTGIRIAGTGHSVQDNLLTRCRREAVHVTTDDTGFTANAFVENNTCIACGRGENPVVGLRIDSSADCVVRKNIFFGSGVPYLRAEESESVDDRRRSTLYIDDNLTAGGCQAAGGCAAKAAVFADSESADYMNDSGYGARGWAARGEDLAATFTPGEPIVLDFGDDDGADGQSAVDRLLTDMDQEEAAVRSLFFEQDRGDDVGVEQQADIDFLGTDWDEEQFAEE